MDIGCTWDMADLIGDLLRNRVVCLLIGSDHLYVNRRRESEVQNLRDDVGRLEEEFHAGKMGRQKLPQVPHQLRLRGVVFRVERDQRSEERRVGKECRSRWS